MSGKAAISKISFLEHQKPINMVKMRQSLCSNVEKAKKIEITKDQLKTHLIRKFRKENSQKQVKQHKFNKMLEKSTESISDERNFTCAICLQILISPVIFECGHFGCLKCIETVTVYQNKCFLCRKVFQNLEYKPSQIISTIISKNIIKNLENPIDYYTRLADHLEWPKKKQLTIGEIQIGKLIDVRCAQSGKWKNGIVLSVKNPENSKYFLLIKYRHEGQNIQELIDINSSRLAKNGFYTEKKAIQASNETIEETEVDIPQISVEDFQTPVMDRNPFFVGRKDEGYFLDVFSLGEDFGSEQKPVSPVSNNEQEGFDYFERDLEQFLNPFMGTNYEEPELLEVYY